MDDSMISLIVKYLNAGLSEEDIAEKLTVKMPSSEFAFRVAAMLGRAADDPDGIQVGNGEYGIQIGVVADYMVVCARRYAEEARPVCPSNDFGCPHWTESGRCTLKDPAHECDDYMYYVGVDDGGA